ncbi:MAG: hypothetical protein K9W46_03225 [Candidatus Heimdallarchaeum endolithica]|uniref:Membrane-associated sensor domain-containing protein n=1 Tax=Candidatus Heimdallarchaeum endolithica TaxID=2876572 RepID=A0A9Y1BS92_9ARCH|nr:MAG: hypothetical protein K9W46_03225 [Candidatus Heimdallarchaeum endolithica]
MKYILIFVLFLSILIGLFLLSNLNFLFFHTLIEFSIIVTLIFVFVIALASKNYLSSYLVVLLGISKIFVGLVEFLHTLAYKGMNIFPSYDANLPSCLWILARYIDALTLILLFIFYKRDINSTVFVSLYTVFTGIMLYLVFAGYFPVCYIEGVGLTVFKKISEYFVSSIFLISAYFVYKGSFFAKNIRIFFFFHLFFLALSELFFTFYVSVYGISNVFGHFFAFLSVSVLFYILIKEGIMKPYNLILNELITTKNKVEQLNKTSQAIYSIIKHDLTNRITSMIGFLELYKLERDDKYCDNLEENLNIASIELENLTALINQDFVASSYSINLKKEIHKLKKQFKTEFII